MKLGMKLKMISGSILQLPSAVAPITDDFHNAVLIEALDP